MSKRFRLLIILILVGIFLVILFPSVRWHFLISDKEKLLATSTNEQIRDYAVEEAGKAVTDIMGMINQTFEVNDLKNPAVLLKELKEAKDKVSQLVKSRFSSQGQNLVSSYSEGMNLTPGQMELLSEELNGVIAGPLLYTEDVFAESGVSQPVLELASSAAESTRDNREGKYIAINRFLLEESYPQALNPVFLPEEYSYMHEVVKDYYKSINIKPPSPMTVKAVLNSFPNQIKMLEAAEEHFRDIILNLKKVRKSSITLGLDLKGGIQVTASANFNALPEERRPTDLKARQTAVNDALEILNSRIDKFGISEPEIRKQGDEQILISLPGLADPERIKSIILGKGRLSFHIVDEEGLEAFSDYYRKNPTNFLLEGEGLVLRDPTILPPGTRLLEVVEKDKFGIDQRTGFSVVKEEIGLEGKYITDAETDMDQRTFETTVVFKLNTDGANLFDKFTNENVGKRLAVVMDDKVRYQGTIQQRISGGSVSARGFGSDQQEAEDLARVLKTGALPVPLEISAQEAVGASLGADAINMGINAIVLGLALVFIFMLVYYRGGGVISCVALVLNFFMMAAILSVFNFTLTLPSIASFILTVGMAVDANVIIFERIKEEYRLGKSRKASVKAGFSKAFGAILDANITTAIAALALAYFGKGTIKGFAVVLVTGIVSSMFTALFVSRLLFDFVTDVFKATKLSLDWKTGGAQNE